MITVPNIFFALALGILPALVWLSFWLREDSKNPEPTFLILKTFLGGMAAVILVLPFQRIAAGFFLANGMSIFILWAIIEEGFKLAAAYYLAIRCRDDNEPVDPMIYMITAALGFVALENALFIINPLIQQDFLGAVSTGSLRFLGASLLHVVSSSTIGIAFALSFYQSKKSRILSVGISFILAVFFHTAFNLFIINQNKLGTFLTFGTVWAGITVLLLFFEKIKQIPKPIKLPADSLSAEISTLPPSL